MLLAFFWLARSLELELESFPTSTPNLLYLCFIGVAIVECLEKKNLAAAAKAAEMEMEAAAVEAAAAAERAAKVVELLFQMAFLATG